jgi:hypothetical protein
MAGLRDCGEVGRGEAGCGKAGRGEVGCGGVLEERGCICSRPMGIEIVAVRQR